MYIRVHDVQGVAEFFPSYSGIIRIIPGEKESGDNRLRKAGIYEREEEKNAFQ